MTETQKRIEAYQKVLPDIKEKVVAVAMLLALSVIMLSSASFAWLTISRKPEVSEIATNVAANGNLEIALVSGTEAVPIEPGESQVGDSAASEDQTIAGSNLTWGNLINLSDPSYGLGNLTLRPAQLNTTALLTKPLYGAVYSEDGRIEKLNTDFAYTSWVPPEGNVQGRFMYSQNLGVRAISSTKVTYTGANAAFAVQYNALRDDADQANITAGNAFTDITRNTPWMTVLAKILGVHMTATLNYEDKYINASITQGELESFIEMYEALKNAHELEALAIAKNINLQLFLAYGGDTTKYVQWEQNTVLGIAKNDSRINSSTGDFSFSVQVEGKDQPVKIIIKNFKAFINDYNMLLENITKLNEIKETGDLRWTASGLKYVVAKLMNVDTCLVKKQTDKEYKTVKALMTEFTSGISGAMTALGYKDKACDIIITNGVLKNLEQRMGTSIYVENMKVTATMYVATGGLGEQVANIYAYIKTDAAAPSYYSSDLAYADTLNTGVGAGVEGEIEARDTYGLAVDLWVRTNAYGSYLVLEGNVLSQEKKVPAKVKDANGNEVDAYTLTRAETFYKTDEEGNQVLDGNGNPIEESIDVTYDLYQSEGKWYDANTFEEFDTKGATPIQKMDTIEEILGYEGENRVWQDNELLTVDATTQGSGSCYVYYAETPEDQARSLELLKAMNVAFVNAEGTLLATAVMDTDRAYAESGRVTVPLALDTRSTNIGSDDEAVYAITALEQNVATRITAIVYLDGTKIENNNVLAAADIQGQLNIQLGSSQPLNPISDEKLETAERNVTASVSPTEHDYDTATDKMISRVTVNVTGDQPSSVTAFFLRQVSSTQGSKEEEMTFTKSGESWVADYEFTTPGTYVLRSVQLDGVDYDLPLDKNKGIELPKVVVKGFTISNIGCSDMDPATRHINVLTADTSKNVSMSIKFATNDPSKLPKEVYGRFIRDDGIAVSVNFTLNPTTQEWNGNALFLNSGEYEFQYLTLDGKYVELKEDQRISASITLGMKVAVYTTSPRSFKYVPSEMAEDMKLLKMQVKILDNSGEEISTVLPGIKLYYSLEGSQITKLDTDLTWNPVNGFYEGQLKALESGGPGNWLFDKVTVGTNTISMATTSPRFSIISPEPPSYIKDGPAVQPLNQFVPNGGAVMQADLKYSSTATVVATITDSYGKEYEVQGTILQTDENNVTTWNFAVPNNTTGTYSGKQDGYWTLKEVKIWNYYDADGNFIGAEIDEDGILVPDGERDEPMSIDVTKAENNVAYTTRVVQSANISFDGNTNKNITFNGSFLQSHYIYGIVVDITDFEGKPISGISNMQLAYDYDGGTLENGGYTSASAVKTDEIFIVRDTSGKTAWTTSNNGIRFTFSESAKQTVMYAGKYTPRSFTFTVDSKSYSATAAELKGLPTYTVKSDVPKVQITNVAFREDKFKPDNVNNSFTDTYATVYFGYDYEKPSQCSSGYTDYPHSSVTIEISNIGKASEAKLTFSTTSNNGSVYMYTKYMDGDTRNNSQYETDTFVWTPSSLSCQRWIGRWVESSSVDTKVTAGLLKATELVLTYDGKTFTVPINKMYSGVNEITINNPN